MISCASVGAINILFRFLCDACSVGMAMFGFWYIICIFGAYISKKNAKFNEIMSVSGSVMLLLFISEIVVYRFDCPIIELITPMSF